MTDTQPYPAFGLVIEGDRLTVSRTRRPNFFDPRFLLAALLDHVARGDGQVCDDEAQAMLELIAGHFALDTHQAEVRLAHALNVYSQSMDLDVVGALLSEVLTDSERVDVMWMMLCVAAADGRRGIDELEAVDEVAAALTLTEEERHAGFQRYFEQRTGQDSRRSIHPRRRSGI